MLAFLPTGYGQDKTGDQLKNPKRVLLEIPDGAYVASPREMHATSPAYRFYSQGFSIVQVNVNIEGNNIVNDAANEPSIAFNPNDPGKIAIGWRQFDNISNSFRQAGYGYTEDAGQTWIFPGVIDPGIFRSDPVLGSDGDGNFYYNSLTVGGDEYWCNVYKSDDGGSSWGMGTYAHGGDKQWMSIDKTSGIGAGNIYEFWSTASSCYPYLFTRSTDNNLSYEDCSSIPGDPYWGTTFVSPDGELYVGGALWSGFMVAKSSNAQNSGEDVSWDFTVSVDLNGQIVGFGGYECPNPGGLLGQTIITMDSSGGPGNGIIYLLCSVERFSTSDPCDIMFARSTDGGLTWSFPVRVNDDPGNNAYQWFGTMSVAPDGRIDVIWLDTRDNSGLVNSALYYSYSLDQGLTWTQNVKLSDSFNPHIGWPQQDKMGDYFDMYSDDAGAHLAWAATFNGEQDVYYSVITPSYVGMAEKGRGSFVSLLQNFPNPFMDKATIRYNLIEKGFISLKVYTMTGREVTTLVNEIQETGLHQAVFNATGLESGVYYYRLQAGGLYETRRLVLLR
ncbi:MAG: T9SS type A sorting domain-containing protein [Bacteroidales bacterium]